MKTYIHTKLRDECSMQLYSLYLKMENNPKCLSADELDKQNMVYSHNGI